MADTPVVLFIGARQTGKATLAQAVAESGDGSLGEFTGDPGIEHNGVGELDGLACARKAAKRHPLSIAMRRAH